MNENFRFERAYPPAEPSTSASEYLWLPFAGDELVVSGAGDGQGSATFLRGEPNLFAGRQIGDALYLGTLDGVPCLACEVTASVPDSADQVNPSPAAQGDERREQTLGLRALYDHVDETEWALAGYAAQLLHWRRVSRFCPACGQPTQSVAGTWGRRCPVCGHTAYPHVSPAVLILVHDGAERVLLASKGGWGTRYSILAGFVEPGESLEECVRREAMEEAGVPLADLVYQGSQPWPFPHQVMIGFSARYAGPNAPTQADLRLDETELARADWFSLNALPDLPPPLSLSRQMIDAWAKNTAVSRRG